MRRLLPLLPPWLISLWVLSTAELTHPNINGDSSALGWEVLGALVATSTPFIAAPFFGRDLLARASSSSSVHSVIPNALQASCGTTLVRLLAPSVLDLMTYVWTAHLG